MTTVLTNSVYPASDARIDGLIEGGKWYLTGSRTLTYSFHNTEYGSWNDAGKAMFINALQAWSNVANINFAQATGVTTSTPYYSTTADMAFVTTGTTVLKNGGQGIFPDSGWGDWARTQLGFTDEYQYPQPEGDISVDQALFIAASPGDAGFMIALHEIGHTLGLKHPHDGGGRFKPTFEELEIDNLDAAEWTVMSYDGNDKPWFGGHQATPMPLDILAIQYIYGANTSYHSGSDTYKLAADSKIWTIWDAGGADTLDASNLSQSLKLDLREGAQNKINDNTLVAIAYNVFIENGIGGSGSDTLTGNVVDNSLSGGSGNDTLYGLEGNDTLDGGTGNDVMVGSIGNDVYVVDSVGDVITENAGEGTDTVRSALTSYALGANLENLIFTGTAAATLTGNAADNLLVGGAGNDTLTGGTGTDTLVGGLGDDLYVLSDGLDAIVDDGGIDTIATSLNTLSLAAYASVENLRTTGTGAFTATGNALANVITGGAAGDTLSGGDGNDTLDGGAGADTLIGGAGNDVYLVNSAADTVVEQAGEGVDTVLCTAASYALSANVEALAYSGLVTIAFTGIGNADANTITGGAGNDTLDGGAGADTLIGGAGNDTYGVDNAGDVVSEAANAGTDTVRTTLSSYSLAPQANLENLTYTGSSDFAGTGNAAGNVITGGAGNDSLDGGAGADTLTGGLGNDTYMVDNAADVVVEIAGQGSDTINTTLASYTLAAGLSVETLHFVGAGGALLIGNADANTLVGGAGNDTLRGGGGADVLIGGAGNDQYEISSGLESVSENAGEGIDTVRTGLAQWTLGANLEALVYTGTAAFTGTGNALSNTLIGGAGADTLDGGAGADTLTGGAGNDTYMVDDAGDVVSEAAGGGIDTIVAMGSSYSLANAVNVENLRYGGGGSFTGTGDNGANTLLGGGGNDTLDGGGGSDWLSGGAGNDIYVVDAVGDVAVESAGQGEDTVVSLLSSWTLGINFENLRYGGAGAFTGTGNAAANILTGGGGNDTLDGGGGGDTLVGGGGDDLYLVTSGLEIISEAAGAGFDTVRTAIGTWTLADNVEAFVFTGAGSVTVTGNAGANMLVGGLGGDTLDGGAGADFMLGGGGDDVYVIDNVGDQVVELPGEGVDTALTAQGRGSLHGLIGVENLTFTGTGTFIGIGNGLDNVLTGGADGNTLDGGAGNDTLIGGVGDDVYRLDAIGDVVVDSGGFDWIETSLGSFDLATTPEVENLRHLGVTSFIGHGNDAANTLMGGAGNDQLDGGLGADLLQGGGGNDLLVGGAGDVLEGGAGNDVYIINEAGVTVNESAGEGNDTIRTNLASFDLGAEAPNVETLIYGGNGNFAGLGSDADNTLIGGSGNDTLVGGNGNDWLIGGVGADTLDGGNGNDTVDYRSSLHGVMVNLGADDQLWSGITVQASTARDGWGGVDVLSGVENVLGSAGADFLRAASGGSRLDGWRGDDTLVGNDGADVFVFGQGGGNDSVVDFDSAADVLDFSAFHISLDTLLAHVSQQGNDSIVTLTDLGGGRVDVVGVNLLEARHLLV